MSARFWKWLHPEVNVMNNVKQLHRAHRKTSSLKEEISEFKRRRIKETACHMFYCDGYEATTIEAIAKELDVTKPFIYSYFKNKSELLYEICKTGVSLSLGSIEAIQAMPKTSAAKLKLAVDDVVRIVLSHQEYIVVYEREEKNLDLNLSHTIRKQRSLFDHRICSILQTGCETGEFSVINPIMTATTISGMMTWVAFWYSPNGRWTEAEITAHVMEMVMALVFDRGAKIETIRVNHTGQYVNA
jgi:AcrR family transcriptional regulator